MMARKKINSYEDDWRDGNIRIDVWEERDRLIITVYDKDDNEVASWIDDDAFQMFEDGFFEPMGFNATSKRRFEESVVKYLDYITPKTRRNPKRCVRTRVARGHATDYMLRRAISEAKRKSKLTGDEYFVVYDDDEHEYVVCSAEELDTYYLGEEIQYSTEE